MSLLTASGAVVHLSHPLTLGLILISSAVAIGALLALSRASWFFYLLVLVFLGGVMVLVIYMATLSANEKFSSIPRLTVAPAFAARLPVLLILHFSPLGPNSSGNGAPALFIYDYVQLPSLITLMAYLLLTLVCVVKLVKFESGPLVKRL